MVGQSNALIGNRRQYISPCTYCKALILELNIFREEGEEGYALCYFSLPSITEVFHQTSHLLLGNF